MNVKELYYYATFANQVLFTFHIKAFVIDPNKMILFFTSINNVYLFSYLLFCPFEVASKFEKEWAKNYNTTDVEHAFVS